MVKKDKRKGKGAEMMNFKTQQKLCHKFSKILKKVEEEDIEIVVQKLERKREKFPPILTATQIDRPTSRINFSFVNHPLKDQLILFGGEYFNGKKTYVYNDLIFYNIAKKTWTKVNSTSAPPPRCGHQMVATAANNGQLWLFGGEFMNSPESQFYHYQDLWVYHISSKKWDKVEALNGPSPRSGHRMILIKKKIFLFGGFHDKLEDFKYFNDVYVFNLEDYKWSKIVTNGTPPAPRSGCCMTALPDNRILIYGGYSKERIKKDVDKGNVYSDAFILEPDKRSEPNSMKYIWQKVKLGNQNHFQPRCGMSMVASITDGQSAYCFGGVFDTEEDEEDLSGHFFNDFYELNLKKLIWYKTNLNINSNKSKTSGRKLGKGNELNVQAHGKLQKSKSNDSRNQKTSKVHFGPSPRMNCGLAINRGILYLYGGTFEDGDNQHTFNDLYSIDLKKLNSWKILVEDNSPKVICLDSSSSSESDWSDDSDSMDTDD